MQITYEYLLNEKPDNGILYHYTDQNGLCGIIGNKKVWATNIYYLNDSEEFKAAADLAVMLIDKRMKRKNSLHLKSVYAAIQQGIEQSANMNVFVCSFSGKGDHLGQWRGYCNGGSGYSIGFDYNLLNTRAKLLNFILGKCVYKRIQHIELINEMIDTLEHDYETKFNETDEKQKIIKFRGHSGAKFTRYAPLIKNNHFYAENEWRLISRPKMLSKDIKFRAGKSMLTPYFEFPLVQNDDDPLEIKKVTVGPCPHIELSIGSVHSLLFSNDCFAEVRAFEEHLPTEVVKSKIPFRNW